MPTLLRGLIWASKPGGKAMAIPGTMYAPWACINRVDIGHIHSSRFWWSGRQGRRPPHLLDLNLYCIHRRWVQTMAVSHAGSESVEIETV
jgi:hypothetical protein